MGNTIPNPPPSYIYEGGVEIAKVSSECLYPKLLLASVNILYSGSNKFKYVCSNFNNSILLYLVILFGKYSIIPNIKLFKPYFFIACLTNLLP
jgi:hypothetical protein